MKDATVLGVAPATTDEDRGEPLEPLAPVPEPPAPEAGSPPPAPPAAELPAAASQGSRRPARYGLVIHYEARPEDASLARLVDTVVWVNEAHPAYARAVASRSEGYHLALCVAMVLAPLVTESGGFPGFVTEFLRRWGKALRSAPGSRPRRK